MLHTLHTWVDRKYGALVETNISGPDDLRFWAG